MNKVAAFVLWVVMAGVGGTAALGQTGGKGVVLHIAAAADLQPVMPKLAQEFEQQTGIKLEASFGSSSALATQVIQGAPIDVFLGADFSFPEKVIAAGLGDEKQAVPYANGRLVLWERKDSPLQPLSMDLITDPRVTRIAIADQTHAPFGFAAYALLNQMKVLDKVKPKLVVGESVAQTAQFAESGNAQMGFISLTLAKSPHMSEVGTYVLAPMVYPKIRQCAVVVKTSHHLPEARKFLEWLTSPKVQDGLQQFGLEPAS